jgi:hypothetical protein
MDSLQNKLRNTKGVTRGSVVGWGAKLQAGTSRVQIPMRLFRSDLSNPFGRIMALWLTHLLREISTMNLAGRGVGWGVARRCHHRLSRKCGILDISQPYRHPLHFAGIPFLLCFFNTEGTKTQRQSAGQSLTATPRNFTPLIEPEG